MGVTLVKEDRIYSDSSDNQEHFRHHLKLSSLDKEFLYENDRTDRGNELAIFP